MAKTSFFSRQVTPLFLMLLCAAGVLPVTRVSAAGTSAGTSIVSQATVHLIDGDGLPQTVQSNAVTFRVDERLGVTIVPNDATHVTVRSPDTDIPVGFQITNTGNGPEPFLLLANAFIEGDQYDPVDSRIVIDANANGLFDPDADADHIPGMNDPILAADQSLTVFVVSNIPAGETQGNVGYVDLTVVAATGLGAPGTIFVGQGTDGVDAVVGATGTMVNAQSGYAIAGVVPGFEVTQSIVDPFGGNYPVPGAIITYTLTTRLTGSGNIDQVHVTDFIPDNTTYLAGTLTLDGAILTDADDSDAGHFTGSRIEVDLETLTAPVNRVVVFQVKIN